MNKRIVTWAAVACISAYASTAGAVALGEMRALSALGEPLKLKLALTDLAAVNPADVRVVLAPADDYTRLGLIPPLGAEQWQVAMQSGNGLSAIITSDTVPQEPNVSFLVQVIWPGNIQVQQVTAVFLPAVMAAAPIMTSPVLATVATAPVSEVIPAGSASVPVAEPAAVAAPPAAKVNSVAEVEQIAVEPVSAHIKAGDTLSGLARGWYVPQASLQQRQQVLAEANPQLFISGNINQLRRGAIIRYPLAHGLALPDAGQAAAWLAARQANTPVKETALDQPALSAQPAAVNSAADQEVTLTLVSPDGGKNTALAAGAEADAAGKMGSLVAKKNALLAERAALQAELTSLEKSGSGQDARLKLLNARLAQLNTPTTTPASTKSGNLVTDSSLRPSLVAAAIGLFLAFLLVLRRRAAAASAAAEALRAKSAALPENDYVAFEPLEALPIPAWSAAEEGSVADPDEEYDFLSDAESAALQTRLDLAQAYIDMHEMDLAKELLSAVVARGNAGQRSQATALLANLA